MPCLEDGQQLSHNKQQAPRPDQSINELDTISGSLTGKKRQTSANLT